MQENFLDETLRSFFFGNFELDPPRQNLRSTHLLTETPNTLPLPRPLLLLLDPSGFRQAFLFARPSFSPFPPPLPPGGGRGGSVLGNPPSHEFGPHQWTPPRDGPETSLAPAAAAAAAPPPPPPGRRGAAAPPLGEFRSPEAQPPPPPGGPG